ncbi:hypothetical protein C0992_009120 [Termitomyces sp. T32_za158]|nr:hypothetical protein C0992_009120 [Termitomyces sp. T32_za158]
MSISSFKDPWFSTKTLPDGQHNITFEALPDGFVIDYMAITPGNDTILIGKQLIVDDTDPSLTYTGQWVRNTTAAIPVRSDWGDLLGPGLSKYNATSFGGGFHETEDPQASVNFTFIGSSVSVYGFYDFKYPSLPATFTIDGNNDFINFHLSDYLEQASFLWFESSGLLPGSHILSVTFKDPSSSIQNPGGRFTLDYIVYTPSFPSLAKQGDPTSVTSSSFQSPSSTRQISLPTATTSSHSVSTAVLIGAPIATIVGILLVACLVYFFRRWTVNKKIRAMARLAPDPYLNVPNSSLVYGEPLIVPAVEFRKGLQPAAYGRTGEASLTILGMNITHCEQMWRNNSLQIDFRTGNNRYLLLKS